MQITSTVATAQDDAEVLAQISATPQATFVAAMLVLANGRVPEPGQPVLVKVKGVSRPIRIWKSLSGTVGADKPSVLANKTFAEALASLVPVDPAATA